jgi:protein FRA10AC1
MRWRTKEEVLAGKGQFSCANLSCGNHESTLDEDPDDGTEKESKKEGLRGFELMFEYVEKNEKKNALVKVRVCDECAAKLQYIRGSSEKKRRRDRSRDKDKGRARQSRHRSGSQNREERGRRKNGHEAGSRDRDRSRSRKKRRERRRPRSPRERDEEDRP